MDFALTLESTFSLLPGSGLDEGGGVLLRAHAVHERALVSVTCTMPHNWLISGLMQFSKT
jgi:hypothetical protein